MSDIYILIIIIAPYPSSLTGTASASRGTARKVITEKCMTRYGQWRLTVVTSTKVRTQKTGE
jgi:hypothetical protein